MEGEGDRGIEGQREKERDRERKRKRVWKCLNT